MISIRIGRRNDNYIDIFFDFLNFISLSFPYIGASQFECETLLAPLVGVFDVLRIAWQKTLLKLFRSHFQCEYADEFHLTFDGEPNTI